MGYAARVMRGLIIDHARNRLAQNRGSQFELTSIGPGIEGNAADGQGLARIGEALDELAKAEPALAEVVDLKFFCSFSFAEVAVLRGVSERTVQGMWQKARIYLHRSISAELSPLGSRDHAEFTIVAAGTLAGQTRQPSSSSPSSPAFMGWPRVRPSSALVVKLMEAVKEAALMSKQNRRRRNDRSRALTLP